MREANHAGTEISKTVSIIFQIKGYLHLFFKHSGRRDARRCQGQYSLRCRIAYFILCDEDGGWIRDHMLIQVAEVGNLVVPPVICRGKRPFEGMQVVTLTPVVVEKITYGRFKVEGAHQVAHNPQHLLHPDLIILVWFAHDEDLRARVRNGIVSAAYS